MRLNSAIKSRQNDNNNNTIPSKIVKGDRYVERRLFFSNKEFLIRHNGGTGDCMFKAVSQAVFQDEQKHTEVRMKVVDFIINSRWDKLKESIEIQHIQGNSSLLKKWKSDPTKTYKKYMSGKGTLGSSSELNAAGELFKYNFATIQEYIQEEEKRAYRVENCFLFDDRNVPFHYFLFTGDFDNGHWEYLEPDAQIALNEPIEGEKSVLPDGLYSGECKIFIEGSETTVEDWLKIHTDNTNDVFQLKHSSNRYPCRKSAHPFEWNEFEYGSDNSVTLSGEPFRISRYRRTDFFSVLAYTVFANMNANDEAATDNLEEQILKYRLKNVNMLNYKLVTQPHSHGFDIISLKYLSMPCKGNIQDLLSAADIFGFSFQVFIKVGRNQIEKSCRFVHVDRWGGSSDKVEYFFMRVLSGSEPEEDLYAKWWHLTPLLAAEEAAIQQGDYNNHNAGENESSKINKEGMEKDDGSVTSGDSDKGKINESGDEEEEDFSSEYSALNSETGDEQHFDKIDSLQQSQKLMQNEDDNNPPVISSGEEDLNLPKRFKTVVELFDEKSNKRKKYVYDGFIPKDEVLEALHINGYIKKFSADDSSGSRDLLDNSKRQKSLLGIQTSESKESKLKGNDKHDENRNKEDDGLFDEEESPAVDKKKSSSAVALVDTESVERIGKFLRLHYRVAPYAENKSAEKETKEAERKSWLQRFTDCLCSACRKN